jgi:AAA15 family ATPase/GTPase
MKIDIENFGPIANCKIEQKPLTVFVGPNGTGKTWTAYLITCLLGPYMYRRYRDEYSDDKTNSYSIIDDTIKVLLDEGSAKLDMEHFFNEYAKKYMSDVANILPKYFDKFIGSSSISFNDLKIDIDFELQSGINRAKEIPFEQKIGENKEGIPLLTIHSPKEDSNIYIIAKSSNELLEKLPRNYARNELATSLFYLVHSSFLSMDYYLPPERTGLVSVMSNFSNIFGQNGSNSEDPNVSSTKKGKNKAQYAYPILKAIDLFNCSPSERAERLEDAAEYPEIQLLIVLSEILEHEILGGNIEMEDTENIHEKFKFKLDNGNTAFELPPLSSSVKDLTPLVLYLKYYAEPRHSIVLDEPEMNLHPDVQLKLIELLAMMVNSGINVIITTHSPYLVDHISNLTKAYRLQIEGKSDLEHKFKLKNDLSFLDPDDVAVYLFENGTASSIMNENGVVDWKTFGDVSDYVEDLYFELER